MTKHITTPADDDLRKHAIRTVRYADNDRLIVEVETIRWPHPHKPVTEWIPAAELPADAPQSDIDDAVIKILRRRKFFKVCSECGRRMHSGHMYDVKTCHSCAETKYHVCY